MSPHTSTVLRKILHIDMDAFFASVEQRDDPALRGRPVAVGGSAQRGVVAAASYEARRYGVRSAMPSSTARRLCPELVFVKPRFEVYREVSQQIRQIFARYADAVEPLSLDEAYLDVSNDRQGIGSATRTASRIRAEILSHTGLTASAGVSYNKFLAKIASDHNKPNGQFLIRPEQGPAFVAALPIQRFYGVGPKTAQRMQQLGILSGADLRARDLPFLESHFGKFAQYLFHASRARDDRPVRADRVRKSLGAERTSGEDLQTAAALSEALTGIVALLWPRLEAQGVVGRTLTLKVKFSDFRQLTRAHTLALPLRDRGELESTAQALLQSLLPVERAVRLLGLTLSALGPVGTAPTAQGVAEPAPQFVLPLD
jgi:DNA polymerase-4